MSQFEAVRGVCISDDCEIYTANDGDTTWDSLRSGSMKLRSSGEMYMIAVDPEHQGRGIALELGEFAVNRKKEAGMEAAMVETGADPGHEPARRTVFSSRVPSLAGG